MVPKNLEKLLGLLAGCVILAVSVFLLEKSGPTDYTSIWNDSGESLFHAVAAVRGNVSFDMPLFHVFISFLVHAPRALKPLVLWLVGIAPLALVFSLGCLVHSRRSGFLAVILAIGAFLCFQETSLASFNAGWEQWFYSIMVLIVSYLTAWEERGLEIGKNALLGIAIGISLLVRSPLVLYAPMLAAFEWLKHRAMPVKARWKALAMLCCVPYLLLLPWVRMNWVLHHKFIPLENGRADCNIMTGALGLVPTINGTAMGLQGLLKGETVLVWASKEVARHPFRYLNSCLSRALYAASFHPLLFILAGFSLGRNRGLATYQSLGFSALYFFGIHCLLPLEHRYLIPLELLLAVLAAGLVARPQNSTQSERLPIALTGVCFASITVLAFYALGLVSVYAEPPQPAQGRMLEAALRRYPEDSWLWFNRGKLDMSRGRLEEAVEDFQKSLRLNPNLEREIWYAQALFLRRGDGRDFIDHIRLPKAGDVVTGRDEATARILLLKALARMQRGQSDEAASLLAQIMRESTYRPLLRRVNTDVEKEAAQRLRSVDLRVPRMMDGFLESCPSEEQVVFLKTLVSRLQSPALGAQELPQNLAAWKTLLEERLAILYQYDKKYAQALRMVDSLIRSHPSEARFYLDRGVLQVLMGKKERAIGTLRAAIRIDPRFLYSYVTLAGLYQSMGRETEALKLYNEALSVKNPNVNAELRSLMLEDRKRLAMRLRYETQDSNTLR